MDIVSRLIQFRDYTELSNSQFADRAEIPRPTLSQFLNGRNKRLSDDLASKIHVAFPNLNMMWLLFGEGHMLVNSNIKTSEGKIEHKSQEFPNLFSNNQEVNEHKEPISEIHGFSSIQKSDTMGQLLESSQRREKAEVSNNGNSLVATVRANPSKTVNRIMVFYTDNSFEEFRPVTPNKI